MQRASSLRQILPKYSRAASQTHRNLYTTDANRIRRGHMGRNFRRLFAQSANDNGAPNNLNSNGGNNGNNNNNNNDDDDSNDVKKSKQRLIEKLNQSEETVAETVEVTDASTTSSETASEPLKTDVVPHTAPDYLPYTPVIAVNSHPVFPDFVKIISISDKNLANLIQKKIDQKFPYITVAVHRDDNSMEEVAHDIDDLFGVGTVCQILEMKKFEPISPLGKNKAEAADKSDTAPPAAAEAKETTTKVSENDQNHTILQILVQGLRRTKIVANLDQNVNIKDDQASYDAAKEEQGDDPRFLVGHIDHYPVGSVIEDKEIQRALSNEIILAFRDIMAKNPLTRETIASMVASGVRIAENPAYLSDMCAAISSVETEMIQSVLEEPDLEKRLKLGLEILKLEQKRYIMQEKIRKDVDEKMKESSRKYILEQELKHIKKELGITKDDKEDLIEKFLKRLEGLDVPEYVMETINDEVNRFKSIESHSSEFQVTRNYLDWITSIHWGVYTKDTLDLMSARKILDEDHYSMKDVKSRILEFIAVTKLRGNPSGKIICFHWGEFFRFAGALTGTVSLSRHFELKTCARPFFFMVHPAQAKHLSQSLSPNV